VFTAIFICIVCGLRKKIKTSIEVLEETSKALSQQPSTFAVPICTLIAQIGFIALWAVTTAYIMSSSETVADVENNNYVKYVVTDTQYVAFIYMLFALFWFTQLFVAMEEFVVGSVIVIWYASGRKDDNNLSKSIWRLFRYHFGAVVTGSFLIAIVQTIRAIVTYIEHKMEEHGATENCLIKFLFCCIQGCLACCQKCLRFINKTAYTESAIYGMSFWSSCCRAFHVLTANLLLVTTLNSITSVLCFIVKILISAAIALLGYLWIEESGKLEGEVVYSGAVVIFLAMFSYFIVDTFTDLFDMASDAMLICVLEDKEKNPNNMIGPPDIRTIFMKNADARGGDSSSASADPGADSSRESVSDAAGGRYYPDISDGDDLLAQAQPAPINRQTSVV